jgi:hypothetical protein
MRISEVEWTNIQWDNCGMTVDSDKVSASGPMSQRLSLNSVFF